MAAAFSAGPPPRSSAGSRGLDPERARIELPFDDVAVPHLDDEVRPRRGQLVDPVAVDDEARAARRGSRGTPRTFARARARRRRRRRRARPAGLASGPRTLNTVRVPSSWRTGAAWRIAGWCTRANMKPKPCSSIEAAIRSGGSSSDEPELLEDVGRAAGRARGAVAVLRDRCSRRRGDERRGGRDVERARAVAARADDVDDRRPRRDDRDEVLAHRLREAGDLVDGLALGAKAHQQRADLRRRRLAAP